MSNIRGRRDTIISKTTTDRIIIRRNIGMTMDIIIGSTNKEVAKEAEEEVEEEAGTRCLWVRFTRTPTLFSRRSSRTTLISKVINWRKRKRNTTRRLRVRASSNSRKKISLRTNMTNRMTSLTQSATLLRRNPSRSRM